MQSMCVLVVVRALHGKQPIELQFAVLQALYRMTVTLHVDGYGLSDTACERFGVREIHSEIDPVLKGHVFSVNGVKVWSASALILSVISQYSCNLHSLDGFCKATFLALADETSRYLQVFIRGGNYIASDWLLRWSGQRYRNEVRMHAKVGSMIMQL